MYIYKPQHNLSDSLKNNGLRVRVGLGLDLGLSLSLLGLIPFPFLFLLAQLGSAYWALTKQPVGGHLMCCSLSMHSNHWSSPCLLLSQLIKPYYSHYSISHIFIFSSRISSLFVLVCCIEISASNFLFFIFLTKGKASQVVPSSSCLIV